jgi:riboflavin synthase
MFTGIIEALGIVHSVSAGEEGSRLVVAARAIARETAIGDSIAVNGVCLTAVEAGPETLAFDAIPETLRRSNLGELSAGDVVNLERPLAAGARLSGHFVQGHVDGVGRVAAVREEGSSVRIGIAIPPELRRYVVEKGSVAVDGISLTAAAVTADSFEVAIIPHTRAVTTLGRKGIGASLNLEVDILAKYVENLLAGRSAEGD